MHMRSRAGVLGFFQSFIAAVQLLSRFPAPVSVPFEEKILRRSLVFYPLVGALIGSFLWAVGGVLSIALPAHAAAALLTAAWAAVTGGLHLDGLMDTADGVLSHRSRERMLEIMKDSHTGAMGVMACVLQLLCKYALLSALLAAGPELGWHRLAGILILTPLWSRWAMTGAMVLWPYAGGSGGLGAMFREAGFRHLAGSSTAAILLAVIPGMLAGGSLLSGLLLVTAAALAAGLTGAYIAVRLSRKLGGLTGDTYGAINELTEAGLLLAAVLYAVSI